MDFAGVSRHLSPHLSPQLTEMQNHTEDGLKSREKMGPTFSCHNSWSDLGDSVSFVLRSRPCWSFVTVTRDEESSPGLVHWGLQAELQKDHLLISLLHETNLGENVLNTHASPLSGKHNGYAGPTHSLAQPTPT